MMVKAAEEYESGKNVRDICMELGCARSTFYKRYRKMKDRPEKAARPELDSDTALEKIIDGGLSSGEKLERLRRVSEILTDRICEAASDDGQFMMVISSDRQSDIKKAALTSDGAVKRLDTKMIKEMASTVRVLTDCVRSLYGIPTFGESSRLYLAGKGFKEGEDTSVTVKFIDGVDYAE